MCVIVYIWCKYANMKHHPHHTILNYVMWVWVYTLLHAKNTFDKIISISGPLSAVFWSHRQSISEKDKYHKKQYP